jgi:DNA-binding transcriptional LysR family regulator
MVNGVLRNELDIGLVTLPIEESRLAITPLHVEPMVAILPASTRNIPDRITPDYVAGQFLVLEFGGVSNLINSWLAARALTPQSSMTLSAIEAVKIVVSAGMGMSIVPAMAVAHPGADLVVRAIDPPMTRALAIIQHRNKPDDRALRIVRDALMELTNIRAGDRPDQVTA